MTQLLCLPVIRRLMAAPIITDCVRRVFNSKLKTQNSKFIIHNFFSGARFANSAARKVIAMSLGEFVVLFIVSAIVGAIGEALVGYSLGGCAISAVVGFIGALIGTWLKGVLNMGNLLPVNMGGRTIDIVWAVIGSALLVFILGLVRRRRTVV